MEEIDWVWFDGAKTVGISGRRLGPEILVQEMLSASCSDATPCDGRISVAVETTHFKLPRAPLTARIMAVYTECPTAALRAFIADYDMGVPISCKGHRRGRGRTATFCGHRPWQLHPHALREARCPRICRSSSA